MASCCNVPKPKHHNLPTAQPIVANGPTCDDSAKVVIPSGFAQVGTDQPVIKADGEGPARRVPLKAFAIDRFAVTNRRFAAFITSTGYRTDAEQFGWSFVFRSLQPGEPTADGAATPTWWRRVDGASWQRPTGSGSSVDHLPDHPATHVSWSDACAFAAWAGGRLPTEAEWEHAARGGRSDAVFPWGNVEPEPDNLPCNIWRGVFPYAGTSDAGPQPVTSHEPNGFGLYNMCGNVWEWSADRFRVRSLAGVARRRDADARRDSERVLKGGSFLCHKSYCYRYRIAARTGRSPDTSAAHTGFRVAYDVA